MYRIHILLLVVLIYSSCSRSYEISGKLDNMPAQSFRLEELAIDQNVLVDSGLTNEKGEFRIKHHAKNEALYRIKFEKGKYILLALKPGDHVQLSGDWNSLENYKVSGSYGSEVLKSFLVNLRENMNDIKTMQIIMDSIKSKPKNDSLVKTALNDLKDINARFLDYVKQYADTVQSCAAALFAANIINPAYESPYLNKFYAQITKRFPKEPIAKQFSEKYFETHKELTTPENTDEGTPAPDFSANTPDGKTISLHDFKGKYVFIDFWASWCAPCREENPNVVKIYNQVKDKNIVFIGVSLDTQKDKWTEAIQKDGLTWTHVSELNGWASTIARNYGVTAIPSNYLIDPSGNIIAKNVKGDALFSLLNTTLQ